MAISTQITRLSGLRDQIRTKLISMGLVTSSAKLDDCADAIDDITENGNISHTLDATSGNQSYTVPQGYHSGAGTVQIVAESKTLTANGTYTPTAGKVITQVVVDVDDSLTLQAKTSTPTKSQQVIQPDSGYDGLSQVTVNAIPAAYQDVTSVTAVAADVLANKIIVNSSGTQVAGTMANNGTVTQTINGTTVTSYTIPQGYHSGSGTVSLDTTIETALAAI